MPTDHQTGQVNHQIIVILSRERDGSTGLKLNRETRAFGSTVRYSA
jgi:hypothetical protein